MNPLSSERKAAFSEIDLRRESGHGAARDTNGKPIMTASRSPGSQEADGVRPMHAPVPSKRIPYHGRLPELVVEVVQAADGGYFAECLTETIFTDGDAWEQLRENVLEATTAF